MKYVAATKIVPTESDIEVWTDKTTFILISDLNEYRGFQEDWASAQGRIYKLWGVTFAYDQPHHTLYFKVD